MQVEWSSIDCRIAIRTQWSAAEVPQSGTRCATRRWLSLCLLRQEGQIHGGGFYHHTLLGELAEKDGVSCHISTSQVLVPKVYQFAWPLLQDDMRLDLPVRITRLQALRFHDMWVHVCDSTMQWRFGLSQVVHSAKCSFLSSFFPVDRNFCYHTFPSTWKSSLQS